MWGNQCRKMQRYDIINYLINKNNYTTYLEIGTEHGENIKKIKCESIESIDPVKNYEHLTYLMTSDEAFKYIKNEKKTYDIIFIDGDHLEAQVDKDIQNSLDVLNKNGVIVVHDCIPPTKEHASDPRTRKINWNGTVYKSLINVRYTRPELFVCVIDTDWGCGLIKRKDNQSLYSKISIEKAKEWEYFDKHKWELLNIISVNDFLYNPKYVYFL